MSANEVDLFKKLKIAKTPHRLEVIHGVQIYAGNVI